MDQIFGKLLSGEPKLNFFGPAGGSRTRKGAFALKSEFTWLVETEIAFSVNSNTCREQQARQIVAKVIGGFSKFFFNKNGDISRSGRQISLRSFQSEAFCMRILMVQARGLGKFCSSRTTPAKVGKMDQIFGKVLSGEL